MARNIVNIEEVFKAFDIKPLLEKVSLGVSEGDRIGIVGRNGCGKSTLMKVIAGIESPDAGRVTKSNSVSIGLLSQVDKASPDATVGDVVLGEKEKHEWAGNPLIREIFTGLFGGFDDHLFDRKFISLSGGEKRRVGLAKLLISDLDLLLLDELAAFLQVWSLEPNMPLLIFPSATNRQFRVGLLVLEQHVLTVGEISAEFKQPGWIDAFLVNGWRRTASRDSSV